MKKNFFEDYATFIAILRNYYLCFSYRQQSLNSGKKQASNCVILENPVCKRRECRNEFHATALGYLNYVFFKHFHSIQWKTFSV